MIPVLDMSALNADSIYWCIVRTSMYNTMSLIGDILEVSKIYGGGAPCDIWDRYVGLFRPLLVGEGGGGIYFNTDLIQIDFV